MATNGWALPVTMTNDLLVFAWYNGITNATVTLNVTVAGQTLTAKTSFEVRKVDASWNGNIQNSVKLYTDSGNWRLGFGEYHFTHDEEPSATNIGNAGITFIMADVNLKGYTGDYTFWLVQVGSAYKWANLTNGTSIEQFGAGLDTKFYAFDFGPTNFGIAYDSPFLELSPDYAKAHDECYFTTYLLWKPTPGWLAPVRYITWDWQGTATNMPPWSLVTTNAHITDNNEPALGLPAWTANILVNPTVATNNFWLP
jgi:hypothetical protein